MSRDPDRPPDAPYGPGWSNAASSDQYVDWGASADRKPRPRTARNAAVVLAASGTFAALLLLLNWLGGDFRWSQLALAVSQLGLSITMFFNYKKLLNQSKQS